MSSERRIPARASSERHNRLEFAGMSVSSFLSSLAGCVDAYSCRHERENTYDQDRHQVLIPRQTPK
jgi:hypothetical protein